jgi:signal transduction protein with GAF and PtsI domain
MKKLLLVLVIVVVLAIGGYLLLSGGAGEPKNETPIETVTKRDGVIVAKTDVTKSGSKVPQGFPSDIPIESVNITDSYKAFYERVQATQYTVNYTSDRDREDLWNMYSKFMNDSGYRIDVAQTSRGLGQISGAKGDDSMTVIVTSSNGISLVQLSYLDR